MRESTYIFTNGMIPLTGALLNFVFNNMIAGWTLTGCTAIIFIIGIIVRKKENKQIDNK